MLLLHMTVLEFECRYQSHPCSTVRLYMYGNAHTV